MSTSVGASRSHDPAAITSPSLRFGICAPWAHPEPVFTCSLCGLRFTHGDLACRACPMASGCDVVACPGCGFQFPRQSRIARAIGGLWNRFRRKKT